MKELKEEIAIKKVGLNHLVEISEFLVHCWKSTYENVINDEYLSSMRTDYWVDFLYKKFQKKEIDCLIAEIDGEVKGVCVFGNSITGKFPDDGEIISLYVLPEYSGKGMGHQLFTLALSELKEKGFQSSIVCVFNANLKATQFYKNHGFVAMLENEIITMGKQEMSYSVLRKE